jgi:hypothetical protein
MGGTPMSRLREVSGEATKEVRTVWVEGFETRRAQKNIFRSLAMLMIIRVVIDISRDPLKNSSH